MSPLVARLKSWAASLKRDVVALWIAARDPRVPWHAKALCAATAAYAFSPIDLIPDFIPVVGYLDDLILLPLAIMVAVRLIPPPLMAEFRAEADRMTARPASMWAAAAIIVLWIASGLALFRWLA